MSRIWSFFSESFETSTLCFIGEKKMDDVREIFVLHQPPFLPHFSSLSYHLCSVYSQCQFFKWNRKGILREKSRKRRRKKRVKNVRIRFWSKSFPTEKVHSTMGQSNRNSNYGYSQLHWRVGTIHQGKHFLLKGVRTMSWDTSFRNFSH